MASGKIASWAHGEEFVGEDSLFEADGVLERARERGSELGIAPVLPGAGAMIRVLAAAVDARSAVEIGTGAGVASLYLLSGMNPAGVLTTIDPETENQRAARAAFTEAGIRPARARTIAGSPREVIGRLTDHAYDLVSFSADAPHAQALLEHARRLLRPGGVLVILNALYHDRVADPAARDAPTQEVRALLRAVAEAEDLVPALVPSGDGVLAAVLRP
ncbi:class I SAM-dependent methyltransferase [Brachybacterium sp. JHP9]|uniref:Class I SAM-dependent methyltransferase n=1 Tax=Brachybacterium equifaecis TaxID=2910770 RepID=A0ABT0QWI7_9MICO|nr:class I SAM-dependent methyltransferase [Brachybacterium equifaecis]MCL6422001.1 class I SAM-dependent methyltransferase [Brachybacterium equifaecis]